MGLRRSFAPVVPQQKSAQTGLLSSFKGWEKTTEGLKAKFLTATGKEGRYTLEQLKSFSRQPGFSSADQELFRQAISDHATRAQARIKHSDTKAARKVRKAVDRYVAYLDEPFRGLFR
jgi:hypothetical protein